MTDPTSQRTLANGIPFAHIHTPGRRVEYLAICIGAGSRDESRLQHGLAHFVEHTIFKGTSCRSSLNILSTMEELGGELNAYTTKEETMIYTVAPEGNLAVSAGLLADLLADATFPDEELNKERQVIADEIDSYRDMPSEVIFDDFEDMLFKGSSLGHPILGTRRSIEKFDCRWCMRWVRTFFRPERMAVVYMGPKSAAEAFLIINETIGGYCQWGQALPPVSVVPPVNPRFEATRRADCHQSHILLGMRAPSRSDSDRYAWTLMSNMLGGPGMNSLLNVALREKRGLVYSVEASYSAMTDCGLFTIYFGCDHKDTDTCLDIVADVIDRMAAKPVSQAMLEKAKNQFSGQLTVGTDSPLDVALGAARSLLRKGWVMTLEERIAPLLKVSAEELSASAGKIRKEHLSMLILR
ncbi:MAG: insulinase family protein [Bacteroides sp.]|nr:insulinase family protein [Bacteroides sp.]